MLGYILVFVVGLFYGALFCYITMSIDKQIETDLLREENKRLNDKIKECTERLVLFQTRLRGDV